MSRFELALLSLTLAAASAHAGPPVDPPRTPDALRTAWRYVGRKADANSVGCPPAAGVGWSGLPLFADSGNRELARYCVYEHHGTPATPPVVEGLTRLDPDAMAVMPSGALADALWPAVTAHFLSQAGDVELPATGGETVRLAIVDTAATRESGGENSPARRRTASPCSTWPDG